MEVPNPTPEQIITAIHQLGTNLGFDRVRIDRQQHDRVWFEVGYGCREILVRTSSGARYRADADKVNLGQVAELMMSLLQGDDWVVNVEQREDAG